MKKILFTCALLLAFGSTKASNDNPTTKNANAVVVVKEKGTADLNEQSKTLLLASCWQ
ncbi:hypothetical protein [Fibrella forsythiae]|uniref:Uncharacterized protein n=1 Tax=Fibrella forsythiae TaxID=2817061 RepID=A0ABS3JFL3_9BACT|nr:hypothetical protein [Fibrella forsythiae]MBO0948791.1 hypothetical protein [Fibrella forsythiae]